MRKLLFICAVSVYANSLGQADPYLLTNGFSALWQNPATYGSKYKLEANVVGHLIFPKLTNDISVLGNVAYRFDLKNRDRISFGMGAYNLYNNYSYMHTNLFQVPANVQFHFERFSASIGISPGINYRDYYPFYNGKQLAFTMGGGLSIYTKRFYFSGSVNHITGERFSKLNSTAPRSFWAQTGYKIPIRSFSVFPMVNYVYTSGYMMIHARVFFQFPKEIVSIGGGYIFNDALTLAIRLKFRQYVIMYNFQGSTSALTKGWGNIHELRLSFLLSDFKKKETDSKD